MPNEKKWFTDYELNRYLHDAQFRMQADNIRRALGKEGVPEFWADICSVKCLAMIADPHAMARPQVVIVKDPTYSDPDRAFEVPNADG